MSTEQAVLGQETQWSSQTVAEIHKQFDDEFHRLRGEGEVEVLMQKFFGFTGIVEENLRELATQPLEPEQVMETAFELVRFRAYIYTCFFFNHFEEAVVETWWKEKGGFQSWTKENPFSSTVTSQIKAKFDKDFRACNHASKFQELKNEYLGPIGQIPKALMSLQGKAPKEHLEVGAELFNLKSYIDYTLYAAEVALKATQWPDRQVRGLLYQFEKELYLVKTDEEAKSIVADYLERLKALAQQAENDEAQQGQIQLLEGLLQDFAKNYADKVGV